MEIVYKIYVYKFCLYLVTLPLIQLLENRNLFSKMAPNCCNWNTSLLFLAMILKCTRLIFLCLSYIIMCAFYFFLGTDCPGQACWSKIRWSWSEFRFWWPRSFRCFLCKFVNDYCQRGLCVFKIVLYSQLSMYICSVLLLYFLTFHKDAVRQWFHNKSWPLIDQLKVNLVASAVKCHCKELST